MFTTATMQPACTTRAGYAGPEFTQPSPHGGRPGGGPAPLPLMSRSGDACAVAADPVDDLGGGLGPFAGPGGVVPEVDPGFEPGGALPERAEQHSCADAL